MRTVQSLQIAYLASFFSKNLSAHDPAPRFFAQKRTPSGRTFVSTPAMGPNDYGYY